MNRFVFDTNIIVSALLIGESVPGMALVRGLDQGTVLISEALISELSDVLGRPGFDRYVTHSERSVFLQSFIRELELVTITEPIQVCRDPKDDSILEIAINGDATYIVTGDSDLLVHNPFRGIKIVTPSEFLHSPL